MNCTRGGDKCIRGSDKCIREGDKCVRGGDKFTVLRRQLVRAAASDVSEIIYKNAIDWYSLANGQPSN